MIVREDRTIKVDDKPDSREIKYMFPRIKELAIYWSAQKRSWFVSCMCTENEAEGIKALYSNKKSVKVADDEEFLYGDYTDLAEEVL